MQSVGATRIHLCGHLTVRVRGERVESGLPGRQGRLLFAYLASHRARPTPRSALLDVLWPDTAPAAAESSLAALLAKLRRVLGTDVLGGRHELQLQLPPDAWIDIEAAAEALHRAESAIAAQSWADAWGPCRVAMHVADRGFLPGHEGWWITPLQEKLAAMLVRAHECMVEAGLGIRGAELLTAERAARRLVELAPLNERGCRLLMQTLALRGNVAEALQAYERLRTRMREDLGSSPGPQTQAVHRQLLSG